VPKVLAPSGHASNDHTAILLPGQPQKQAPAPAPTDAGDGDGYSARSAEASSDEKARRRRITFAQSPSSLNDDSARFEMTHAAATPVMPRRVAYADPSLRMERRRHEQVGSASGSVSRPDFDDCLRRSAAVLHKHVTVCEWRRRRAVKSRPETLETGQFHKSKEELFEESRYVEPQREVTLTRFPFALGFEFGMRRVESNFREPDMQDIYTFLHTLFIRAHLSSECSIVCLIYVERLMEKANVPLLATTWRPVILCAMLLASKVWQDCASWNIEFSVVFPAFSLAAINELERNYVTAVGWDMYISQSLYAKYYFALRSLNEKQDFRRKYNRFVLHDSREQPEASRIVEQRSTKIRSEWVKVLSRSL